MEAKTEEKPEAQTQLATRTEARPVWEAPRWDQERLELARKAVTPPTATPAEFEFFIAWCKRTGLDPFIKQAYLIERGSMVNGSWVKKHEPMASASGLAARADAMPDFRGMDAGAVYEGDDFDIIRRPDGATEIHHHWSPTARAKAGNKLLGAWAHGKRDGRVVRPTWLPLASRIQRTKEGAPTKFWATMPEGQIVKCAEAEQFRLLYPNIFGAAYIREEMPEEERDITPGAMAPAAGAPNGAVATEALAARIAAQRAKTKAANPSPPKVEGAPADKAPEPSSSPPRLGCIRAGKSKGALIAALTVVDLETRIAATEAGIAASPRARWVGDARQDLADMRAELEKRDGSEAPADPPGLPPVGDQASGPREPGSDEG